MGACGPEPLRLSMECLRGGGVSITWGSASVASWVCSAACAAAAADAEVGGATCCSWFAMASMSSSSESLGDLTVWLPCCRSCWACAIVSSSEGFRLSSSSFSPGMGAKAAVAGGDGGLCLGAAGALPLASGEGAALRRAWEVGFGAAAGEVEVAPGVRVAVWGAADVDGPPVGAGAVAGVSMSLGSPAGMS